MTKHETLIKCLPDIGKCVRLNGWSSFFGDNLTNGIILTLTTKEKEQEREWVSENMSMHQKHVWLVLDINSKKTYHTSLTLYFTRIHGHKKRQLIVDSSSIVSLKSQAEWMKKLVEESAPLSDHQCWCFRVSMNNYRLEESSQWSVKTEKRNDDVRLHRLMIAARGITDVDGGGGGESQVSCPSTRIFYVQQPFLHTGPRTGALGRTH